MELKHTNYYRLKEDEIEKDQGLDRERNLRKQQTIQLKGLKAQLEWVKRQIEYLQFAETHEAQFELKKGEVYEFDWGINVNSEFSNRHYGVVLAYSGKNNPLVLVCPLKTNRYGANPHSDVNLGIITSIVTDKETLAVVNQIRALDKMRLYVKPIIHEMIENQEGKILLQDEQMKKIECGILRVLQVSDPKKVIY